MKKNIKILILIIFVTLFITSFTFLFIGCFARGNEKSVLEDCGEVYDFSFDEPFADDGYIDKGMKIDGVLDENVWNKTNFYTHSEKGVNYKVGTYFTDNGVYIAAEAIDSKIIWSGNLDFDNNSSFMFTIVGADAVNDLVNNNLASVASHPTEKMIFQIDTKNARSANLVPLYARAKSTDTSLTAELFITWKSLHFSGKQDKLRINTAYRKVYSYNNLQNFYIFPSGIKYWVNNKDKAQIAYHTMNLFDENGSVSTSGSIKNTSLNTLGNSAFGFGATENWDLSLDKKDEIKTAKVTKEEQHQIIYLKDSKAKYFEFETNIKFDSDLFSTTNNAGIVIASENLDVKSYVVRKNFRSSIFGDAIKCEENNIVSLGNNSLGAQSLKGTVGSTINLKVIKYGKVLFYFYRQANQSKYSFLNYEELDCFNDECVVGLYSSCLATFENWNYTSYDDNPSALSTILDEYVYVIDLEYDDAMGQAQVSTNVIAHSDVNVDNDKLNLSIVPVTNYYVKSILFNEEEKVNDFMENADNCVYEYTPTCSTKIKVVFAKYNTQQQNDLQKVKLSFDTTVKKVSGVVVTVYPTETGYANKYFYQETTSSAGAVRLNLPYKNSVLYPSGTYHVKIEDNSFLHYETIITVEKSDLSQSQIDIKFPQEFVIQGTKDNVWSINDDKILTINANNLKDNYSLAYVCNSLVYGEIEGTFTTDCKNAKMNYGFGYHVDSGADSSKIGFIGVSFDGSNFKAVTYSMLNYITKTNNVFNQGSNSNYSELKKNGDIQVNGNNITMTMKLVKSQSGLYLYIGDTLVNTFSYAEIGIENDQDLSFGIMTYSEADFNISPTYEISDINVNSYNVEDNQGILKATLQGGLESENDKDLYVTLKGKNKFGFERTYKDIKAEIVGSYYLIYVDELSNEIAQEFEVEFYQGKNTLRLKDNNPIIISLQALKTTEYSVQFNEFKKDYNKVFKINGKKDIVQSDIALIGDGVSMPATYIDGKVIYELDKTASNGAYKGIIPNSNDLFEISGVYVKAYSIEDASVNMTINQDENGYSFSFPRTRGDKYVYSTDYSNGFEITVTITGDRTITELDSGFAVTDGTSRRTFFWASWSGAGLVSRNNWEQVEVETINFGSGLKPYNCETNKSIRIKMVYYNLNFRFYQINGNTETYIGCLDLNENSQYNQAGWKSDTPLSVGFTSWNGSKAGATFSNIVFKKLDIASYNLTTKIENSQEIIQKLYGIVGEQISVPSVLIKNRKAYVIDYNSQNVLNGVITKDGSLNLCASYKYETTFKTINGAEFDRDEDGLVIDLAQGKNLFYEEKTNAFEITATITGNSSAPDLDSGFLVSDGITHFFFFWSSWDTFGVRYSWDNTGKDIKLSTQYGFNPVTNPSIRIKMVYDNLECKFYKIDGQEETLFATYDISSDNRAKWNGMTELYVGFASWNHYKAAARFSNIVYQKNEHEVLPEIIYVDYTINATIEGFSDTITINDIGRLDSTLFAPKSYQKDGIVYRLDEESSNRSIKLIDGENVLNVTYVKNFELNSLNYIDGHFNKWDIGELGDNPTWATHKNYINVKAGDKILGLEGKILSLMIHEYNTKTNSIVPMSIYSGGDISYTITKDCAIIISLKKGAGLSVEEAFEGIIYDISADNPHLRNAKEVNYTINLTLEGITEPISTVYSGFVGEEVSAPVAYQKDGIVYRLDSNSTSLIKLIDGENSINANYVKNFNINDLNWEVGQIIADGTVNSSINYYSTKAYIKVKAGDKIIVNASNTKVIIARYSSNSYSSYTGQDFIQNCPTTITINEDCYIRISIRRNKTDIDPIMTIEEAKQSVIFEVSADNGKE